MGPRRAPKNYPRHVPYNTPVLRRSKRLECCKNRIQGALPHDQDKDPLLRAGVLADIQYAPIPDGFSHSGKPRYYQHSLEVARFAAKHFEREKVDVVLNLGDIVDGKCQAIEENGGQKLILNADADCGAHCVDRVIDALVEYKHGDTLHIYGNHCLYNLDRPSLQTKLGIPFVKEQCGDLVGYYSYLKNNVRFIVLDSYDISLMRRCQQSSEKRRKAVETLRTKNPNFPAEKNSPDNLNGLARRFVAFNGAIDNPQLNWLQQSLEQARQQQEIVIVLSHQPILPGSCSPMCLMWNFYDVLKILRQYRDVVAASFSGHAHKGGYRRDGKSGIHFRVFEAVLENPPPHKTYAMVTVHKHRLTITGLGNCESAVYELDHNEVLADLSKR